MLIWPSFYKIHYDSSDNHYHAYEYQEDAQPLIRIDSFNSKGWKDFISNKHIARVCYSFIISDAYEPNENQYPCKYEYYYSPTFHAILHTNHNIKISCCQTQNIPHPLIMQENQWAGTFKYLN